MNTPITEFTIENQSYLVFEDCRNEDYKDIGNAFDPKTSQDGFHKYDIVGELTINKKQYLIVPSEGYRNENSNKELKKPVDILSRRELQIVMLVAEGRVNKQIADQLNISVWTVSTHLRRIFAKLGVDTRSAMVYRCSKQIKKILNIFNGANVKA